VHAARRQRHRARRLGVEADPAARRPAVQDRRRGMTPMPTVRLTTGLPASGKSTRALQLLADSGGRMRRVNLDDIRDMLDRHPDGRTWTHQHEATAQAIQEAAVLAAVKGGFDVVIDNTHLTPRMPGRLKAVLAPVQGVEFVIHDFTDVPVEECIRRDAARAY